MAVVCSTRSVTGLRSIQGGGPLSADITFMLKGDIENPGSLYYYGTNSSGVKGWHALPKNIVSLISLEARVAALEATSSEHTSRLDDHDTTLADHESRIAALEAAAASDFVAWQITAVDYTVATGINHVKCTAVGIIITLPAATTVRSITVKNQTGGVVSITSASLIDTAYTVYLGARDAAHCVADGTIWNIV